MFIDTHCHLNIMVQPSFDTLLTQTHIAQAHAIAEESAAVNVTKLINVGTSLIESINCIHLAYAIENLYASVGIHPNDCTFSWRKDLHELEQKIKQDHQKKIVAIGECGLDFHYPDYDKQQQYDVFKAQIELALTHDLALIVHTRDARQETLMILEQYKHQIRRGIIHCFSEDLHFAHTVIDWSFAIGLGGTITYPKNNHLRTVAQTVRLTDIVLETDAPFLPPQTMRGTKNHPKNIPIIARYLADLRNVSLDTVGTTTTQTALRIFKIEHDI